MPVSHILRGKGADVVTLPPTATVIEAAKSLAEHRIGAVLITEGQTIRGILSERDIVRLVAREGAGALGNPVSTIMTADVKTCKLSDSEAELVTLMTEHRIRHLPVMDGKRLVGIISIGDVVKFRMENMERETADMREYIASAG